MKHIIINMTIFMFVAVLLLAHFHVRFEIAATVLCALGSLGVVVLGIFSLKPSAKETGKESDSGK